MNIPDRLAARYAAAVEHEAERTRLYDALLTAQLARQAQAIALAQAAVEAFEGEGDDSQGRLTGATNGSTHD